MNTKSQVKTVLTTVCISVFCIGATVTHAAGPNDRYLDSCRADVDQYFGEEREMRVVSKRRIAEGTRVTLSVKKDSDNAEFVNCWIPNEKSNIGFDQGADTVAATVSPVPVIR